MNPRILITTDLQGRTKLVADGTLVLYVIDHQTGERLITTPDCVTRAEFSELVSGIVPKTNGEAKCEAS